MRIRAVSGLLAMAAFLSGCAEAYTTPGARADFSALGLTPEAKAALTDKSVQKILDKKPMVIFPANISVARVQAQDYTSYSYREHAMAPSNGAYSVITIRDPDVEKEEYFNAISKLDGIKSLAGIKRVLLDKNLNSDLELRAAAASLHADLLLYYTFDTAFHTDQYVQPLGVITLGLFPNQVANVTSTASAVLMDVNNGYVYAVLEATATNNQLANAWTNDQALDDARKRTEREAFAALVKQFTTEWPNVVATYNHPTPSANAR